MYYTYIIIYTSIYLHAAACERYYRSLREDSLREKKWNQGETSCITKAFEKKGGKFTLSKGIECVSSEESGDDDKTLYRRPLHG